MRRKVSAIEVATEMAIVKMVARFRSKIFAAVTARVGWCEHEIPRVEKT